MAVVINISLSSSANGGRRLRNVYDKKSQRYAEDNRTAHLTARSDMVNLWPT